jgi:hypothetical protein
LCTALFGLARRTLSLDLCQIAQNFDHHILLIFD